MTLEARWRAVASTGQSTSITKTVAIPEPQIAPPDARPIVDDLGAVAAAVRGAAAVLEAVSTQPLAAECGTNPD